MSTLTEITDTPVVNIEKRRERASRIEDEINEISHRQLGPDGFIHDAEYGNLCRARAFDIVRIIEALHLKPGERFVDLGSGDGRWVFLATLFGLVAEGYELNPKTHEVAEEIKEILTIDELITQEEASRAVLHNDDLFKADVRDVDAVVFWEGSGASSEKLAEKLLREADPGTRVVIYGYRQQDDPFKQLLPDGTGLPFVMNQTKIFTVPSRN